MRFRDHFDIIKSLLRESVLTSLSAAILLVFAASGFVYDLVLTDAQKQWAAESVRAVMEYWQFFLVAFLLVLIVSLYRRMLPKVAIEFAEDGRFCIFENGIRKYRVDLNNYGDRQGDISFRLEHIQDQDGSYLPTERRGFQREAGRGPMPLSTESPKYGYLAQLDETKTDSPIEILTVSDLATGYQPEAMRLPRGRYTLSVSLNPAKGRPHKMRFSVWVDPPGQLKVREMR